MLILASTSAASASDAGMFSLAPLFTLNGLFSVLMLIVIESVLGVDNVIYQTLSANKLETEAQRRRAMYYGFAIGVGVRIFLLGFIAVLRQYLTAEVFSFTDPTSGTAHSVTWAGLLMIGGGLFLTAQSARHLYHFVELKDHKPAGPGATKTIAKVTMAAVILEMIPINVVFSLDSVFTAQGMTNSFWGMCIAILAQTAIMIFFSKGLSRFMDKHQSFNILALAFLLVIGFHLTCEGLHYEVPKLLVYGLGGFALFVDVLQFRRLHNETKHNGNGVH